MVRINLRKIPPFAVWYMFLTAFILVAGIENTIYVCPSEPLCMLGRYLFSSVLIVSAGIYSLILLSLFKEKKYRKMNIFVYFFIGMISVILSAVLLVVLLTIRLDLFLRFTGLLRY